MVRAMSFGGKPARCLTDACGRGRLIASRGASRLSMRDGIFWEPCTDPNRLFHVPLTRPHEPPTAEATSQSYLDGTGTESGHAESFRKSRR